MSAAEDMSPTKARITIYIPAQLDERLRRAAERVGQTLSVWMQRAAEAALREQERE
jgi:predicted DNA-binding protein